MPKIHRRLHTLLLSVFVLTACSEEVPPPLERVRAIKPFYVSEPAGGETRRYSGSIASSDTSSLSFPIGGTMQTVVVNQGDQVERGQVLATMDPEPYQISATSARSQLQSAQANYENQKANLTRQKDLLDKGWVAKAAYDQAIATFDSAEGDLNVARSRVSSAERDLNNTSLTAPFDGVIATRDVEPFQEVTPGQALFAINSEGALEVDISIPDTMINLVTLGLPVQVDALNGAECGCTGRIIEIGSVAGAANAVTVKAALLEAPRTLLPGMAAEVTIMFTDERLDAGYLVPLVAIAPGPNPETGYVFKYQPDSGTVVKTFVKGRPGRDNLVGLTEGVGPGDIVAAAGVSFLQDGQRVSLMGQ